MPNVTISELPDAILPLDGPNSFFEVQTIESGVDVSRKVASDNIVISTDLPLGSLGQMLAITTAPDTYTALSSVFVGSAGQADPAERTLSVNEGFAGVVLMHAATGTGTALFSITDQGQPFNSGFQIQQIGGVTNLIAADHASPAVDFGFLRIQVNDTAANRDILSANTDPAGDPNGVFTKITPPISASDQFGVFNGLFQFRGDNTLLNTIRMQGANDNGVQLEIGDFVVAGFGGMFSIGTGGDDTFYITQLGAAAGLPVVEDVWIAMAQNAGVTLHDNNIAMARTVVAASGGMEVNNTVTGAGFERVLTTSDGGASLPAGAQFDMAYISTAPSTYSATSSVQVNPGTSFTITDNLIINTALDPRITFSAAVDARIIYDDQFIGGPTLDMFINGTEQVFRAADSTVSPRTHIFLAGVTDPYIDISPNAPEVKIGAQVGTGSVALYDDTDQVALTVQPASGGLQVNNLATGAGLERVLTTSDLGGGGSPIANLVITDNATIDLVDTNIALNVGAVDPDTSVHLEIGIGVFGPGIQAKATDTTVDSLEINRLGGDVEIGSLNASVAGGVNLNFSNGAVASTVIEVTQSGFILEGITGSNTILDWHTPGGNLVVRNVFNGANMQWDGFQNSLEFQFQSRNSGGTIRQLLHMDPDTDIEIYHPPSAVVAIETHTPATGGAFVNNQLTAAGLERVLTESDLTSGLTVGSVMGAVRSNALVRNSTTLVDDPVLSGFPLEPSATYVVECVLQFDGNGNAAAGFQWNWDFNGELADVETLSGRANSHQNDNSTATVRAYQFAQLGNKNPFTNLTIDEAVFMSFGLITQSDYISGTNMDLQWACGTGVTDCRLQEGSYVKITRLA